MNPTPRDSMARRRLLLTAAAADVGRAVAGEFNGVHIVGRAWPAADNPLVVLELTT